MYSYPHPPPTPPPPPPPTHTLKNTQAVVIIWGSRGVTPLAPCTIKTMTGGGPRADLRADPHTSGGCGRDLLILRWRSRGEIESAARSMEQTRRGHKKGRANIPPVCPNIMTRGFPGVVLSCSWLLVKAVGEVNIL